MSKINTIVIFGGEDSEEFFARKVAIAAGAAVGTATLGGKKVHGGNAYQADGFVIDKCPPDAQITRAIIFECNPACAGSLEIAARCDHHNPGDEGYGKGPRDYWPASSIGQLCDWIGWVGEQDKDNLMAAAGDHCPAAAYKGLCPGVDDVEFAQWRISRKVEFYASNPKTVDKADHAKILANIVAAREKLSAAPSVDGVRDLRGQGFIEELPEAALECGESYMSLIDERDREQQLTGNKKIVLGGHCTPERVEAFLAWARTLPNKVGEPYGVPSRGFAGVVVKPE